MQRTLQINVKPKQLEAALIVTWAMFAFLCLMAIVSASGCGARVPASANQPGRAGTPIENALAYNASLAEANKTIAQAVIDASNGAAPLIPVESANKILIMQSKVADADRQVTPLLSDVGNLQKNATRIETLLDDIKGAAGALVSSGELGIKDVATQKKIAAGISNVYNLADLIINTLVQGGVISKQ